MAFRVTIDDRSLKQFSKAMREQVPYATAVALTRTAKQAAEAVQKELPRHFILRNQFTKNSIRTIRAEKRDWPESKAIVGSISPYLVIQEDGGSKTPASKAFSIPKGIRANETKLVPRSKWPGKILLGNSTIPMGGRTRGASKGSRQKPKPFLLREHDGVGVYIRTGKGRKVKRLYRLTRETLHVKGRHWFYTPASQVASVELHRNFVKALDEAMASRR